MRIIRGIATTLIFLGVASTSSAQSFDPEHSIQGLLKHCEALMLVWKNDTMPRSGEPFYCMGMVIGASAVLQTNCDGRSKGFNASKGLSMGQMPNQFAGAQAFINWARANPQHWGLPGAVGMVNALTEAFPCDQ